METIEMTGTTIEEAVAAGMKELGVDSPSQVMVEVLQEPDRGIMGQGARPAKVRLVFMGTRKNDQTTSIVTNPQTSSSGTQIVSNPYVPPPRPSKQERTRDWESEYDKEEEEDAPDPDTEVVPFEQADEDAQVGQQVLDELLQKMEIEGKVVIRKAISTRDGENTHWVLNITGRGMNRLIGRQGETLSSLQYITRLIVSRRLQRRANIIVDAGGYKAKRSDRLKQLANRMADQAVRQRRTVTLEPMPPHERRIIHLTLRKREDVTTRSIGEGDSRKVTISPV